MYLSTTVLFALLTTCIELGHAIPRPIANPEPTPGPLSSSALLTNSLSLNSTMASTSSYSSDWALGKRFCSVVLGGRPQDRSHVGEADWRAAATKRSVEDAMRKACSPYSHFAPKPKPQMPTSTVDYYADGPANWPTDSDWTRARITASGWEISPSGPATASMSPPLHPNGGDKKRGVQSTVDGLYSTVSVVELGHKLGPRRFLPSVQEGNINKDAGAIEVAEKEARLLSPDADIQSSLDGAAEELARGDTEKEGGFRTATPAEKGQVDAALAVAKLMAMDKNTEVIEAGEESGDDE
ncbi:hypothetical protein MBLNU459_g1980t1 [Dothideomycetes sp. NU459]